MTDSEVCDLASKECVPCRGGVPPLTPSERAPLLAQLDGWSVVDGHHLTKTYSFPDFVTALGFVNRVGEVAEQNGHHPDLWLTWGKVRVDVWTHKIDGLTESDFVLAAKCDRVS
jgi:4a-hydroxytetrahydrobiopterin dehydratase